MSFNVRMSHGMLRPCSTRVVKMTQKVRKIIMLRCGRFSGSENAAARARTPRMPAQPTRNADLGERVSLLEGK